MCEHANKEARGDAPTACAERAGRQRTSQARRRCCSRGLWKGRQQMMSRAAAAVSVSLVVLVSSKQHLQILETSKSVGENAHVVGAPVSVQQHTAVTGKDKRPQWPQEQQTPRGCARCRRCTSRPDSRRGTPGRCWCTRCRAPCCAGRRARRPTGLCIRCEHTKASVVVAVGVCGRQNRPLQSTAPARSTASSASFIRVFCPSHTLLWEDRAIKALKKRHSPRIQKGQTRCDLHFFCV